MFSVLCLSWEGGSVCLVFLVLAALPVSVAHFSAGGDTVSFTGVFTFPQRGRVSIFKGAVVGLVSRG